MEGAESLIEWELREILSTFLNKQAQVRVWQCCLAYEEKSQLKNNLDKQMLQVNIIAQCISILNEMEKFVVENHLVYQKTWEETYILFERRWGAMNGRSIRTMKRMQSKAIQKMIEFIHSSDLEDYMLNGDSLHCI